MAEAKQDTVTHTVQRPVEVTERVIVLTLTVEEARTLSYVMGSVGGIPTTSRRKHTEAIVNALAVADIPSGYELMTHAVDKDTFRSRTESNGFYFVESPDPIAD